MTYSGVEPRHEARLRPTGDARFSLCNLLVTYVGQFPLYSKRLPSLPQPNIRTLVVSNYAARLAAGNAILDPRG